MRIVETYSHLNGLEFLLLHKPKFWKEIQTVVKKVDAAACKTKVSQEKNRKGELLYSPVDMNQAFKKDLENKKWSENRVNYWVTKDEKLIRKTLAMKAEEQKQAILQAGFDPIFSYNQTDFIKDRVSIGVQFGKYAFVAYDLFVKHLALLCGRCN